MHLTESCDEQQVHLLTHVETTFAPSSDGEQTPHIHQALATRELLPQEHLVDTGYVDAEGLVSSQQDYGVQVLGPVRPDVSWQAQQADGYDLWQFRIDWSGQLATCPQGQHRVTWHPRQAARGQEVITIRFATATCAACEVRAYCTRSPVQPRQLTVPLQSQHEALQARRREQHTKDFKDRYAARAGIEGTLSQDVRAFGARQSRYVGLAKTHLQQVSSAVALNLSRLHDWLAGTPRAKTRTSRFAALASQSAVA